jgi:hypothetical protein
MPIHVECDDTRLLLTFRIVGSVSARQVIAARVDQAAKGKWAYATIVDSTASTRAPTTDDLHMLREAVEALSRRHGPIGPVALVAPSDAGYGMGRMYEVLAQPFCFAVFRGRAEAARWLTDSNDRVQERAAAVSDADLRGFD